MIWMSGDAWGRALGGGGRLMTGQDPRLCHLGFHYRITTKKDCHPAVSLPNYHRHHLHGPLVVAYHAILRGAEPISGVILTFSNFGN